MRNYRTRSLISKYRPLGCCQTNFGCAKQYAQQTDGFIYTRNMLRAFGAIYFIKKTYSTKYMGK